MASGKSLELAEIRPRPKVLCICGEPYPDHLGADQRPLEPYANANHRPQLGTYTNRAFRRRMGKSRGN